MSPADIAPADLRAGLSRRLADLGLIPPDPAVRVLAPLPRVDNVPDRKAA